MSSRKGKSIDVWNLCVDGEAYTVDIRLYSGGGSGDSHFVATERVSKLKVSDHDIRDLKKAMQAKLEQCVNTTWSDWLVVEVSGRSEKTVLDEYPNDKPKPKDVSGTHSTAMLSWHNELTVEVSCRQLGTTRQGKKVSRNTQTDYVHDSWPEIGEISGAYRGEDARVVSLIPDTPMNREALRLIFNGIATLRGRLDDLLAPAKIEATITKIQAGNWLLLPAKPNE